MSPERAEANAERIVACINACEGINPAAVPDLLAACELVLDYKAGRGEFDFSHLTLAEQGRLHYDCWISTVKPALDSAIARTKGEE